MITGMVTAITMTMTEVEPNGQEVFTMAAGKGKIFLVGFGPGAREHLTFRAHAAISAAEVVVGYNTYIKLVQHLLEGKEIIRSGMQEEIGRARAAVAAAEAGKTVAVISSGDAGIYGMAGLVYEVLKEQNWGPETGIEVEVVPGITAANACAALVGAPLSHDLANISLSDYLTPWEVIARRIAAAAAADFVIVLYNPASGRRTWQIVEAVKIISNYRTPATPVALVKSAYRQRQDIIRTDLAHLLDHEIGMLTTVLIGNSNTFDYKGLMITPRGYQHKYDAEGRRHTHREQWEHLTEERLPK